MKFNNTVLRSQATLGIVFLFAFLSFTCDETLPVYQTPTNVLSIRVEAVEQLSDRLAPSQTQMMRVKLVGENIYDEVFFDTVNITGIIKISWPRNPGRERTMILDEKNFLERNLIQNRKMMILPGQQFGLQFYWNLKGDDSAYFPSEMNFAYAYFRNCGSYLGQTVICSDPEEMIVEGKLTIFKNLDTLSVEPFLFSVVGRRIIRKGG